MPHPRWLGEVLTSADITDWLAYAAVEPFGAPADDVRQGGIAAAVYNVNRDTKKHKNPFSYHDVLPWGERRSAADADADAQVDAFDALFVE